MRLHHSNAVSRAIVTLLVVAATLALAPLELPVGMDFSQVYASLEAVYRGGSVYGLGTSSVSTDPSTQGLVGKLPFPGPPWSFPLFLPLGFFSAQKAAALWAIVQVLCLCAAVALVTPGRGAMPRAGLMIVALLSAPMEGHLVVGQFTILAVVGVALAIANARFESGWLFGVALVLMSFRPHLGGPIALWLCVFLWRLSPRKLWQGLISGASIFCALGLVALLIDPRCFIDYPRYLSELNALPANQVCDTCSSLPVLFSGRAPDGGGALWTTRFIVSGVTWVVLGLLLLWRCRSLPLFVSGATCVALLATPYDRNYDFVLLIVPLIVIGGEAWGKRAAGRGGVGALASVVAAVFVAGIFPYFSGREVQGEVLWLSAVMGLLGALLVGTPKNTVNTPIR